MSGDTKYCEFCGKQVHVDAVLCPNCGRQLENLKMEENRTSPQIVINNNNTNTSSNVVHSIGTKKCDKWVAFLLCFFFGFFGVHKFYEGKTGLGILYIFTGGLFLIGWFIDLIVILCKPNPYYV